ncbi:DUF2637 domain-containing protein [Streptomyces tuirus]|uniref:DUF2637 domain-containing protein n=1 Tax=Streptomyces tuirus TaxID=68278 RepID=A0A7G1NEU9_9ACTN|nr:DUF2637 domain-containing protein [Streptomyces tuirus]BCL20287.1 hypothetical protein GCM10017668_21300 [Streptomyces tuirus]
MKTNPTRALAIAAGLVIVALTAAAFWLSYAHLAEVALAHGMRGKEIRAWAWPATLDLFIVAGELLMLRAALAGRVDRWAIGLTVVGSGSSIALNVAGVGSAAEPLDYVVAAVPPTAALLAFGALMRQIHQALAGQVAGAQNYAPDAQPVTEVTAPVTVERVEDDQPKPALEPAPVVIPADRTLTAAPFMWDAVSAPKVTAAVPAAQPREVVTEVIALSPAELRRKARALHRQAVRSTSRPVTIKTLQDELGLSRREATELRREVVTS